MPRPEIDWLSITILYREENTNIYSADELNLGKVLELLDLKELADCFVPMKGIHRYRARYSFQGITINEPDPERLMGDGTQEKSGMGYNVSMSSTGLSFFQSYQTDKLEKKQKGRRKKKGKKFDFRKLLHTLMRHPLYKVHCSRIDIAMDDLKTADRPKTKILLDMEQIASYSDSGQVKTRIKSFQVTRTKKYKLRKDSDTGFCKPEPAGDTIYIGSRQSEKFVRIYDKLAEQHEKRPEDESLKEILHWVRFEVEYKGDTAGEMLEMFILPEDEWEEKYLSHIREMLDFLENGETAGWWKDFCQNREPVRLLVHRKHTDTGDFVHMCNSFFRQMGRKGLTVMIGSGPKFFFERLLSVLPKLQKKHYSILKGYCLEMDLDGKRGFKLLPTVDENGELQQLELTFDRHSIGFLRESCTALKETRKELETGETCPEYKPYSSLGERYHPSDQRFEMTAGELEEMMYRIKTANLAWR